MTAALRKAESRRSESQDAPPSPEAIACARKKYDVAKSAVSVGMTGPDVRLAIDVSETGRKRSYVDRILGLEKMLAIYIASTTLQAPLRHLSAALDMDRRDVRRMIQAVEAWRGAPIISETIARVEQTVPLDP